MDADELAREREAAEFLAAMTPKIMANAHLPGGIPNSQKTPVSVSSQGNKHAAAVLSANLSKIQKEEAVRRVSQTRSSVKSPEAKISNESYQNRSSFKASQVSSPPTVSVASNRTLKPSATNSNGVKANTTGHTPTSNQTSFKRHQSPTSSSTIVKPPPPPTVKSTPKSTAEVKTNGASTNGSTSNGAPQKPNQTSTVTVVKKVVTMPDTSTTTPVKVSTSNGLNHANITTTSNAAIRRTPSPLSVNKAPNPPPPPTMKTTPTPANPISPTANSSVLKSPTTVSPTVKGTPAPSVVASSNSVNVAKTPPPTVENTSGSESSKSSKPPTYAPRRFATSSGVVYSSTLKAIESQIDNDLVEELVQSRAADYFTNKQKAVGAGKLGSAFKTDLNDLIDGSQTLCKTEEELLSTMNKGKPQLGRVLDDSPAVVKPAVGRVIDTPPKPSTQQPVVKQQLGKVIGERPSSSSFKPQLGRVKDDTPPEPKSQPVIAQNTSLSSKPVTPPSQLPPQPPSASAQPTPPAPSPPPPSSNDPPSGGTVPPPPPPPTGGAPPPPPPPTGGAPPPPPTGGAPPPPPPTGGAPPPPPPPPPPPVGYVPPRKHTPIETSSSVAQATPRKPPAMLGQSGVDLQSELMKKLSSRK